MDIALPVMLVFGFPERVLEAKVTAFPNPARNRTTFRYLLPNEEAEAGLIITDLDGRRITRMRLSGKHGLIEWEAADVLPGIYLYYLKSDQYQTVPARLVIIQ